VDRERQETDDCVIPHVVRRPEYTAENLRRDCGGEPAVGASDLWPPTRRQRRQRIRPARRAKKDGRRSGESAGDGRPIQAAPPAFPPAPPGSGARPCPYRRRRPRGWPRQPRPRQPRPRQPLAPPMTAPPSTAPAADGAAQACCRPSRPATRWFVSCHRRRKPARQGTMTVALIIENATDVASAPLQVTFDPKVVKLNDAGRGAISSPATGRIRFLPRHIQKRCGCGGP